ncbi:molybdopterin-guanine dinucleotide biosynthesis protein B [Paraburkholderia jirisanensis]
MRVIGFVGWSGAGKTTLIAKLIPVLKSRGLSVSTLKHAHHAFDFDQPGKDSYAHREAGATEVLVASGSRWAIMHELRGAPEPALVDLLPHLSPVDLVVVEGYKAEAHARIEVHRVANGKPWIWANDRHIVGVVSDAQGVEPPLPHAHIDDIPAIADLALALALPIDQTLKRLASHR